jgi:hypothetical protein
MLKISYYTPIEKMPFQGMKIISTSGSSYYVKRRGERDEMKNRFIFLDEAMETCGGTEERCGATRHTVISRSSIKSNIMGASWIHYTTP